MTMPNGRIWVVGAFPYQRCLTRALRFEGLIPTVVQGKTARPPTEKELEMISEYVGKHRSSGPPYDFIVEGTTPAGDLEAGIRKVSAWKSAGATWWAEVPWQLTDNDDGKKALRERIISGPPKK